MTLTIQPLSRAFAPAVKKIKLTEPEDYTCDILSVCDSMNKLCETLSKLAYALQRKNMEKSLQGS